MATYIVVAPNRSSVNITCKLGNYSFGHEEIMYDDKVAAFFPSIFVKLSDKIPVGAPDAIPTSPAPVVEVIPEPVVEIDSVSIQEPIQEEEIVEEDQELEEEIPSQESIQQPTQSEPKRRGRKPKNKG